MLRASLTQLLLLMAATLLTVGCDPGDPSKAEYWIPQLEKPTRGAAIKKLREMKAPEAVEPLMKLYDTGKMKAEVIAALAEIGDKKAAPTLVKAIADNTEPKAAQLAAATLLSWGAGAGHGDVLVKVISNPKSRKENLYGALELLAEHPEAKGTSALLRILNGDPDLQPIVLNGLAATALGKLKEKDAVDGLIRCLWLDDALGRNAVKECRVALNRIGKAASHAKLMKTIARENKPVEKRAKKHRYHNGGAIEFKMCEMLGDMPDPASTEALIKALVKWEEMPVSIQDNKAKMDNFIRSRIQRVISCSTALAMVGDDRAVKPMLGLAGSKEIALEFRNSAVQQLAFLGSAKAIPGLLKLLKEKAEIGHFATHGFNLQVSIAIARLLDGKNTRDIKAFEKQLAATDKNFKKWIKQLKGMMAKATPKQQASLKKDIKYFRDMQKTYKEVSEAVAAAKECTTDAACWGKKLGDKSVPVRLMAGYRLAQMKGPSANTAKTALEQYAGDADLVVRNVILFGLRRLGDKGSVAALKKAKTEDEARVAKKKMQYKGAIGALDLTIVQLESR